MIFILYRFLESIAIVKNRGFWQLHDAAAYYIGYSGKHLMARNKASGQENVCL